MWIPTRQSELARNKQTLAEKTDQYRLADDERDIGYDKHGYENSPSAPFPQARPSQPPTAGMGVQRNATAVSRYAPDPDQRIPTSFPVPAPAGGQGRY